MSNDDLIDPPDGALGEDWPGPGPVRVMAEREELADARSRLASGSGYSPRAAGPLMPPASMLAESLTGAALTLHHYVRSRRLYRLGGVCPLPVPRRADPEGRDGVVASWTAHDLLVHDRDWRAGNRDVIEAMNGVLALLLNALGYVVRRFGSGGASLVTGRCCGGRVEW